MQHFKFVNWRICGFVFWCHEQVTDYWRINSISRKKITVKQYVQKWFITKFGTMWKISSGLLSFCTSESSKNQSPFTYKSRLLKFSEVLKQTQEGWAFIERRISFLWSHLLCFAGLSWAIIRTRAIITRSWLETALEY